MKLTKQQRVNLHAKFGGLCAYCGQPLGERWHADHFEPIVRDWWSKTRGQETKPHQYPERDTVDNLMPACAPCNIDKHANTLEGWRAKLQDGCNVLARNHATYRHARRFGLLQETGAVVIFHFERIAAKGQA